MTDDVGAAAMSEMQAASAGASARMNGQCVQLQMQGSNLGELYQMSSRIRSIWRGAR